MHYNLSQTLLHAKPLAINKPLISHTSLGRSPAGPGNFLDFGVLLLDGVFARLLCITGVPAWFACGILGSVPALCLDPLGVSGTLVPMQFLLKVLADCLPVWLYDTVFAFLMGAGTLSV